MERISFEFLGGIQEKDVGFVGFLLICFRYIRETTFEKQFDFRCKMGGFCYPWVGFEKGVV